MTQSRFDGFTTGDVLIAVDGDSKVVGWNKAAEQVTGLLACQTMGRHCWEVLRVADESGYVICRPNCQVARDARLGQPMEQRTVLVKTHEGLFVASFSTIGLPGKDAEMIHLIHLGPRLTADELSLLEGLKALTARQRDVLCLLVEGVPAKAIAARLGLTERTVRNYIHEILLSLRCRSQLEALAKLHSLAIVQQQPPNVSAAGLRAGAPVAEVRPVTTHQSGDGPAQPFGINIPERLTRGRPGLRARPSWRQDSPAHPPEASSHPG